jgi:predicted nucleotidyltransferase component of viral defense system
MMTRTDLEKFKTVIGFNIWQLERDYLQHLALLLLSRHTREDLVFKGGTALQKVFALNRFSIDLDFTIFRPTSSIATIKDNIVNDLTLFGYATTSKHDTQNNSENFSLTISGPLYNGKPTSRAVIRLEISAREKVAMAPLRKEVTPIYTDIQPYAVLVMDMNEILAEKVRAIMTRNKPRDLFDTKFLLDKGCRPNIELINNKLSYYRMTFDLKQLKESVNSLKTAWQKEMPLLLTSEIPSFDSISENICNAF